MGRDMGLGILARNSTIFKQKNRWLFNVGSIADDGANCLPPLKSARPSLSFKEIEAQHLNETIYFPGKPEWKPINLTLYDINVGNDNRGRKVWNWITTFYDPQVDFFATSCQQNFKKRCTLTLFDGCGNPCESWTFENAWPQAIEFGELEMSNSEVITIDMTLRYDRAYLNLFG